jgi:hypothetical protein
LDPESDLIPKRTRNDVEGPKGDMAISTAISAESTFCRIQALLKDLPCSKMVG